MAIVLKKQKSLYCSALKWFLFFIIVMVVGRLLAEITPLIIIVTFLTIPFFIKRIGNFLVGAYGECLVTRHLKRLGDDYYIINDINLPKMQIDHTLVCPKGIFTIETKTYTGKISGHGDGKYWKQYFGKNRSVISRPLNPINQGRTHSFKLHELLAREGLKRWINTIVVFAGTAKVEVRSSPIPVLHRKKVYDYISRLPDAFSQVEIEKYKNAIMKLNK